MEWLGAVRGSTVGLDTAPLIYYIEEHPVYLPQASRAGPSFEGAIVLYRGKFIRRNRSSKRGSDRSGSQAGKRFNCTMAHQCCA